MFYGIKLPAFSILPILLLVSACTSLYIGPPGPERQTLLVLPIEIDNPSRSSYGFHYVYEIKHVEGMVPPYEANFELPVDGNLLIVDSLPPGDYYVDRMVAKPVNLKIRPNKIRKTERHDKFKLEQGSITIFPHFLDVRINQNAGGNARYIFTTFSTDMSPVSSFEREEILASLRQLENFSKWAVLEEDGPDRASLEKKLMDEGYQRLSFLEIKSRLSGNTLFGDFGTDTATIYLETRGWTRDKLVSLSGVESRDRGNWNVMVGGFFCKSWDTLRAGTHCYRIYIRGDNFVLINTDGEKSAEGKIQPGNSASL